ncbi:MAG: hypothetical protein ABC585_01060 [Candidatus Methanosuratincola petrocarbonis]
MTESDSGGKALAKNSRYIYSTLGGDRGDGRGLCGSSTLKASS